MQIHRKQIPAILLGAVAVISATHAYADEETREVEEFTTISYSLPFAVDFVEAGEHYVKLEGDEDTISEIETEVRGNTLKVYKENSWFDWSDGKVVLTIGYTELEAITMAGSGDGHAESLENDEITLKITGSANLEIEALAADEVYLSIAGSGNVDIENADVDTIESKIAGSGDIAISGRAVAQEISISGSGDHQAQDLKTQETSASVRGSGDVTVWAESHLSASVVGSGDIEYYGAPEIKERIMGSGSVVQLDDER